MNDRETFNKLLREEKEEVLVMGEYGGESAGSFSRGIEKT